MSKIHCNINIYAPALSDYDDIEETGGLNFAVPCYGEYYWHEPRYTTQTTVGTGKWVACFDLYLNGELIAEKLINEPEYVSSSQRGRYALTTGFKYFDLPDEGASWYGDDNQEGLISAGDVIELRNITVNKDVYPTYYVSHISVKYNNSLWNSKSSITEHYRCLNNGISGDFIYFEQNFGGERENLPLNVSGKSFSFTVPDNFGTNGWSRDFGIYLYVAPDDNAPHPHLYSSVNGKSKELKRLYYRGHDIRKAYTAVDGKSKLIFSQIYKTDLFNTYDQDGFLFCAKESGTINIRNQWTTPVKITHANSTNGIIATYEAQPPTSVYSDSSITDETADYTEDKKVSFVSNPISFSVDENDYILVEESEKNVTFRKWANVIDYYDTDEVRHSPKNEFVDGVNVTLEYAPCMDRFTEDESGEVLGRCAFMKFNCQGTIDNTVGKSHVFFATNNIAEIKLWGFSDFNSGAYVDSEDYKNGLMTQLPPLSFNTDNLSTVTERGVFNHFNWRGSLTKLPYNSFSSEQIDDIVILNDFNGGGALTKSDSSYNENMVVTGLSEGLTTSVYYADENWTAADDISGSYTKLENGTAYQYLTDTTAGPVN